MDDYYRVWGQGRGGIERVFPEIPLGALGAGENVCVQGGTFVADTS